MKNPGLSHFKWVVFFRRLGRISAGVVVKCQYLFGWVLDWTHMTFATKLSDWAYIKDGLSRWCFFSICHVHWAIGPLGHWAIGWMPGDHARSSEPPGACALLRASLQGGEVTFQGVGETANVGHMIIYDIMISYESYGSSMEITYSHWGITPYKYLQSYNSGDCW